MAQYVDVLLSEDETFTNLAPLELESYLDGAVMKIYEKIRNEEDLEMRESRNLAEMPFHGDFAKAIRENVLKGFTDEEWQLLQDIKVHVYDDLSKKLTLRTFAESIAYFQEELNRGEFIYAGLLSKRFEQFFKPSIDKLHFILTVQKNPEIGALRQEVAELRQLVSQLIDQVQELEGKSA